MRYLALVLGALLPATLAASPAAADVQLSSPRLVATPEVYGGQTMVVQLQASCDDGFGYVRVDLRQRNNTSAGFAGYVLTYNSGEVVCDGVPHLLSVALSDNRFRTGPAELKAERLTPGGTDTTGWTTVKIVKK
jgi:hypothetical protein